MQHCDFIDPLVRNYSFWDVGRAENLMKIVSENNASWNVVFGVIFGGWFLGRFLMVLGSIFWMSDAGPEIVVKSLCKVVRVHAKKWDSLPLGSKILETVSAHFQPIASGLREIGKLGMFSALEHSTSCLRGTVADNCLRHIRHPGSGLSAHEFMGSWGQCRAQSSRLRAGLRVQAQFSGFRAQGQVKHAAVGVK